MAGSVLGCFFKNHLEHGHDGDEAQTGWKRELDGRLTRGLGSLEGKTSGEVLLGACPPASFRAADL